MSTTLREKIKSDFILNKITEKCDNEIYLVGGSVRDFLLEKTTHDRDLIVIDEDARLFSLKINEILGSTFVPLDEENKIYRLVMPDKVNYIDITNPIGNSLEKDLMRRDLTINSIAVNIRNFDIVDITGGVADLKNKCINCISKENFNDDPLRMLRVYRFQSLYGFDISDYTKSAICEYKDLIKNPAVERINYELLRLFDGKYAHLALENMDKVFLLEELFPFVKELKMVPPNTHHHLDLFHHSIETVKQIQNIYENSSKEVKEHLECAEFGGHSRLAHLKLAGFMHDIGKFSTWTIEENGRHRFIKHDDVGAKIAKNMLKNMHFSNKQTEYLTTMIKYHIYPSSVMSSPEVNDKVMMRYVRRMDDNAIDEIILAQADRLSARGPLITEEIVQNNISALNRLLNFYIKIKPTLEPIPKLLSGDDVMDLLNIKPSAKLGQIMNLLHEAQLSGEVTTYEGAVNFVKSL